MIEEKIDEKMGSEGVGGTAGGGLVKGMEVYFLMRRKRVYFSLSWLVVDVGSLASLAPHVTLHSISPS